MERSEALISKNLAEKIKDIARTAKSEEDLKIGIEKCLEPALKEFGINLQASYEQSILKSGSADAIHGHVVIEYEKPGKLSTSRGQKESIEQLKRYLKGLSREYAGKKEEEALRRVVGIALDGRLILFVRYVGEIAKEETEPETILEPHFQPTLFKIKRIKKDFRIQGPYLVTPESIFTFLLYLRSLSKRPLTPELLSDEFGPKGKIAKEAINTFYSKLVGSDNSTIKTFFKEWDRIFGVIYGQNLDKAERDVQEIAEIYQTKKRVDLKYLLFSIHTYYALIIKLIAIELLSLQEGSLISSFISDLENLSGKDLRERIQNLEQGGSFSEYGINNFLEGSFFGWYLHAWDKEVEELIREMARRLSNFESATMTLAPETTKDLLKKLYQFLVPKELRRDLGEYYTPDWLAEHLIDQTGYSGDLSKKILDPACGSGTFLVLAIKKARERGLAKGAGSEEVAKQILNNIVGFDLNPLAVIAARTNYLLALGNLIRTVRPIEIPVYMCDSIRTPVEYHSQFPEGQKPKTNFYEMATTVGKFRIPAEFVKEFKVDILSHILEECIENNYSHDEFCKRIEKEAKIEASTSLKELYEKVQTLEKEGKNGIWARFIKNAFAPVFKGKFDFVIGNPPWIRWGYLSDEYRAATLEYWKKYGLFSLRGMEARLGGGEKDFSMLFVYACSDMYLKDKGILGFLITQEVFKSKGAGEGFRKFQLGESGAFLGVFHAEDLVKVQPFEDAANKTAMIVLKKGEKTKYPVEYILWQKKKGAGRIDTSLYLKDVLEKTERESLQAKPISKEENSSWQTISKKSASFLAKVAGKPAYKALRGASTEPYGVYWVQIKGVRPDKLLIIDNMNDLGKWEIPKTQASIEPDLVYHAVNGGDIKRWFARSDKYVIISQNPKQRIGYDMKWMKSNLPNTFSYLKNFEAILRRRKSFNKYYDTAKDPFYSMFNISEETFKPFKVAWKRMASDLVAVVLSKDKTPMGYKTIVPTDTTSFVPFSEENEAHFVCALLNSSACRQFVRSFSSAGRGFGAPSIINNINIPKFDSKNKRHKELSKLSMEAHKFASEGKEKELKKVEQMVDKKAKELWANE